MATSPWRKDTTSAIAGSRELEKKCGIAKLEPEFIAVKECYNNYTYVQARRRRERAHLEKVDVRRRRERAHLERMQTLYTCKRGGAAKGPTWKGWMCGGAAVSVMAREAAAPLWTPWVVFFFNTSCRKLHLYRCRYMAVAALDSEVRNAYFKSCTGKGQQGA